MGFKVNYKGLEVICDTFEDLDMLAERVRKAQISQPTSHKPQATATTTNGSSGDKHAMFLGELTEQSKRLFKHLMTKEKFTDSEIRHDLDIDTNMVLAGYVSGLTKAAKRVGFEPTEVFTKDMNWSDDGKRVYTYSIVPTFRDHMKHLL